MTALTNFLIATLVSICSTLTGYDLLPQSSDTQISFPPEEITGYNPTDYDNCISFNEKTCIVLKT
ncbi:hypothetical protein [Gillisia limnaea]|uniref:Uncharacterized protein n=1 Tax=Gillisia limnaea (strain DSM 15749 / LMG 21470 / R-8282) TaxID=865937 RepID=H2BV36_GILLR|nr:hypothetical protein [Gillisia limnaea]EHQ03926.1 hypothetical protein Gilli_3324 [Gillisia limnaea DSM 15749]